MFLREPSSTTFNKKMLASKLRFFLHHIALIYLDYLLNFRQIHRAEDSYKIKGYISLSNVADALRDFTSTTYQNELLVFLRQELFLGISVFCKTGFTELTV